MSTHQTAGLLVEDFDIANTIARVFVDSDKPYTFSNVISCCYSTAFNFARQHLVARGIEVDEVNGMEIADEHNSSHALHISVMLCYNTLIVNKRKVRS